MLYPPLTHNENNCMFNSRKRKYHEFYRNKRIFKFINNQGEVVTAIRTRDATSAYFVCCISDIVYEIANAKVKEGRYLFKGADQTDYFLKTLKNLLDKIIANDCEKLFRSKNILLLKGNNGKNFIFNDQDYFKSTDPRYCDYIDDNTLGLPFHEFNPCLDVFVKVAQRVFLMNAPHLIEFSNILPIIQKMITHFASDDDFPIKHIEENIPRQLSKKFLLKQLSEALLKEIKQETKSLGFKKKLNNYNRVPVKNFKSLTTYINGLFDEKNARLLVVRLDLSYGLKDRSSITEEEAYEEYLQAKKDRENLFDNIWNNEIFKHLVGYAWKMEYGLDKGFHFHILLFFDGSKVREDITIARIVGEYWEKDITGGRGLYHNCNTFKDDYKEKLGIGMINYYDTELRDNLINEVAAYLVKTDLYSRVIIREREGKNGKRDNARTFGKSAIKAKNHNRGRPRTL
jgi:hypothetical protein